MRAIRQGSFSIIGIFALALFQSLETCAADASPDRPNILYMIADDLGYADTGAQGCKDVPTPNLDSIASNGVRFTSGHVSAPVCSPGRAGLVTGHVSNVAVLWYGGSREDEPAPKKSGESK